MKILLSMFIAIFLLTATDALALGLGETAITARNVSGKRLDEMRILSGPNPPPGTSLSDGSSSPVQWCGSNYWSTPRHIVKLADWTQKGYSIFVEKVTKTGQRIKLCRLK